MPSVSKPFSEKQSLKGSRDRGRRRVCLGNRKTRVFFAGCPIGDFHNIRRFEPATMSLVSRYIKPRLTMFPAVFLAGILFAFMSIIMFSVFVNFIIMFFVMILCFVAEDDDQNVGSYGTTQSALCISLLFSLSVFVVYFMHLNSKSKKTFYQKDLRIISYEDKSLRRLLHGFK